MERKLATIHTKVDVQEITYSDGSKGYDLSFDGVKAESSNMPTESDKFFFKKGILSERERLWEAFGDLINLEDLRKVLYGE